MGAVCIVLVASAARDARCSHQFFECHRSNRPAEVKSLELVTTEFLEACDLFGRLNPLSNDLEA